MDIIFRPHFFGGKNNNFDDTFVPMCIKSVLKYNPDVNIHFISNYNNVIERFFINDTSINYSKLYCYEFKDFECEKTLELNNNYIHLSHNPLLFEKFAILAYFYINNLMKKLNINNCIVVETDVLVFCDLSKTFKNNYDLNLCHALLADKNTSCCSYINKIYLETFINTSLLMYSTENILKVLKNIFINMKEGGICDMTINDWIVKGTYNKLFTNVNDKKETININELSIILENNSFFDNFLSKINLNNMIFENEYNNQVGQIKKIHYINNEPYFKYDNIFIKCNSIHFQGNKKQLIPIIYNKVFQQS
jgi:hypothetical protein